MSINAVQVNSSAGANDNSELRAKASELVASTFYGTLLKEFRESSDSGMFDGGFGGKAFQQQLDTVFVTEISKQSNNSLVDSIVRQLSRQPKQSTSDILTKIDLTGISQTQIKPSVDIMSM